MFFSDQNNKFCYCRNRRRALWRKHSILLEKWIKQYKLGRIRQVAILNSPVVTSWRTESSNISLVVLDKLLYYSRNLVFFIFQNFLKTDRPTDRPTDIGTYIDASRRLKNIPKKRKIVNVVTPPAKKQRTKGPQEFKCETGDTNFSRKFTLQRHMNNKHWFIITYA